jgi:hypothetical protein
LVPYNDADEAFYKHTAYGVIAILWGIPSDDALGVTFGDGAEMLPGLLQRHRRLGCSSRSRCGSSGTSGGAPGATAFCLDRKTEGDPRDTLNPLIQEMFAPANMR